LKPVTKVEKWKILGTTYKVTKHKCPHCNRYFRDLNMHDKTSRCGRVESRELTNNDKVMIGKIGIDEAIKRRKP